VLLDKITLKKVENVSQKQISVINLNHNEIQPENVL
jgi:hypothetical protein